MKRKIVALSLALCSALAFALPTMEDVQAAVHNGNYAQADSQMQEVLAAKPKSAKAHYVYAEILAHERRFSDAAGQARAVRELDPDLKTLQDPQKFVAFESELQRALAAPSATAAPRTTDAQAPLPAPVPRHAERASSGIPGWVWILAIVGGGFFLLRAVTRRMAMAGAPAGASYGSPMNPGMGNGYYGNGMPVNPGMSGNGSMLRTGLAAAGGVAAGMLAERWLEGRNQNEGQGPDNGGNYQPNWDNGANAAADDLANRPVDFGGGNDWGGDAGGGGGGGDDGGW